MGKCGKTILREGEKTEKKQAEWKSLDDTRKVKNTEKIRKGETNIKRE